MDYITVLLMILISAFCITAFMFLIIAKIILSMKGGLIIVGRMLNIFNKFNKKETKK